jgi:CheY-like chemotaxis protein
MTLTGLRVLVAEDDYLQATDMAQFLEEAGAAILGPARTGREALQLLLHRRPDLAVLDIGLADGICSQLIESLKARRVPYVLVSGYDGMAFPELGEGAEFLTKPVDDRLLRAKIARLLATRSKPQLLIRLVRPLRRRPRAQGAAS